MRIFALSLMLDRNPIIFEDGNQIRDFVKSRWDLTGLSMKKVVQTLKLYSVCGERQRPHILLSGISQPVCYPIDTKTLSEITEKYFDGGETKL